MQKIFKNLFKKTDKKQKMNCDEQFHEFNPIIIDETDNKPTEMTCHKKLSDTLRRYLILENVVLHYIAYCCWRKEFRTIEEDKLYIVEFYKIRYEHLK